jgi:hypothetical protein
MRAENFLRESAGWVTNKELAAYLCSHHSYPAVLLRPALAAGRVERRERASGHEERSWRWSPGQAIPAPTRSFQLHPVWPPGFVSQWDKHARDPFSYSRT